MLQHIFVALLLLQLGGTAKMGGKAKMGGGAIGGGSGPTLVQSPVFAAATTTNTTVAFGVTTTSGSTLVGQCQTTSFGGCAAGDDVGNPYTTACSTIDGHIWACTSYSIGAAPATSMTFTFIFTGFQVGIYEATPSVLDVDPATAQSATTFGDYTSQTVPFTTTHANELLFCNGLQYGTSLALTGETWTVGTAGMGSANQGGMMATATQATAGAGACTMTFGDLGQRSAQLVLGLR
jgi:hypothetical protein